LRGREGEKGMARKKAETAETQEARPGEGKSIAIKCKGAARIPLARLNAFQATLKQISGDNIERLKASILKYGFSAPIFIWRDQHGKVYIMDGHSRMKALIELEKEGYTVPPLPVDVIEARTRKEAKQKLLLIVSAYGRITEGGVIDFVGESEIDLSDLDGLINLPDVNVQKILREAEKDAKNVPEVPDVEFEDTSLLANRIIVVFSTEKQRVLLSRLLGVTVDGKVVVFEFKNCPGLVRALEAEKKAKAAKPAKAKAE